MLLLPSVQTCSPLLRQLMSVCSILLLSQLGKHEKEKEKSPEGGAFE